MLALTTLRCYNVWVLRKKSYDRHDKKVEQTLSVPNKKTGETDDSK